jgi:hypothetical protein
MEGGVCEVHFPFAVKDLGLVITVAAIPDRSGAAQPVRSVRFAKCFALQNRDGGTNMNF